MTERKPNTFSYRRPHLDGEDITNAIEEIQERVCNMSEPEDGTTYEWVNERIEEEVLKLEAKLSLLEKRIQELGDCNE
jgi:hypothetical protein